MDGTIRKSYVTYDNVEVNVDFTLRREETPSGKRVFICDSSKYELRLLETDYIPEEGKRSKVLFRAQITSKQNGMIVHAPVTEITDGEYAGAVFIGNTAGFKKHRALVVTNVGNVRYDTVTMPYPEYLHLETMLKYVHESAM